MGYSIKISSNIPTKELIEISLWLYRTFEYEGRVENNKLYGRWAYNPNGSTAIYNEFVFRHKDDFVLFQLMWGEHAYVR